MMERSCCSVQVRPDRDTHTHTDTHTDTHTHTHRHRLLTDTHRHRLLTDTETHTFALQLCNHKRIVVTHDCCNRQSEWSANEATISAPRSVISLIGHFACLRHTNIKAAHLPLIQKHKSTEAQKHKSTSTQAMLRLTAVSPSGSQDGHVVSSTSTAAHTEARQPAAFRGADLHGPVLPDLEQYEKGTLLLTVIAPRHFVEMQSQSADSAGDFTNSTGTSTNTALDQSSRPSKRLQIDGVRITRCCIVSNSSSSGSSANTALGGTKEGGAQRSHAFQGSGFDTNGSLQRMPSAPMPATAAGNLLRSRHVGAAPLPRVISDSDPSTTSGSLHLDLQQHLQPKPQHKGATSSKKQQAKKHPAAAAAAATTKVEPEPAFVLKDTPDLQRVEEHLFACTIQTPRRDPTAWASSASSSKTGPIRFELDITLEVTFTASGSTKAAAASAASAGAAQVKEVHAMRLLFDQSNPTRSVQFVLIQMPTVNLPPASPATLCTEYLRYIASVKPALSRKALQDGPVFSQAAWLVWHQSIIIAALQR